MLEHFRTLRHSNARPAFRLLPTGKRTVPSPGQLRERLKAGCLLCILVSLLGGAAGAQLSAGTPNFSAYDSHDIDTVDLMNNNILLNVPVMSKGGGMPFNYTLSANYYVYTSYGAWTYSGAATEGLYNTLMPIIYGENNTGTPIYCPDGKTITWKYTNWFITMANGTVHTLPTTDYTDSQSCYHGAFTDTVTDGSGYTVIAGTNGLVTSTYDKSGTIILERLVADSNGHEISWLGSSTSTYTDSLGLTAMTTVSTGNIQATHTWTNVDGGSPQLSETTISQPLATNFGCAGINELALADPTFVNGLAFPDGTTLGIAYEPTPNIAGKHTPRLGTLTPRRRYDCVYISRW